MTRTMPHTVLLDVDGTLVDSNDAHAQSWVEAFAAFGFDVSYDDVRRRIGEGGDKLMPETVGLAKESALGEEIARRRLAIFKKTYLPALRAFPGARELLCALLERGHRLVIASSASDDELEDILRAGAIDDLVPRRTSSSDVERSKPDPDIVAAALAMAGCAPHEAIMLGDTPYDTLAAARAGVRTVALRCGGWDDGALARAEAIYDDPHDLLRRLDTSPLAGAVTSSTASR